MATMHEARKERAGANYRKKRHNVPQVAVCCALRECVFLCEVGFSFFFFLFLICCFWGRGYVSPLI